MPVEEKRDNSFLYAPLPQLRVGGPPISKFVHAASYDVCPFPLPPEYTPSYGAPLADCSDDDLLNAPPALLAHMIRTAACDGLQILSARAVPLTSQIMRVTGATRDADIIAVGSVASSINEWPTYDGRPTSHMHPDTPNCARVKEPVLRSATSTKSALNISTAGMSPAAIALTKAVALVDMQRRDDVGGDADGLAEVVENAWGLPNGTIARAQHFSVGATGPLLRYAIGPDAGLASLALPVHLARCISTFSGTQTREDYGPDVAMDWTRNRVAAEFVFYRSIRLEARSLIQLAEVGPPGDPSLDLSRPGLLVFRPMPCSGFSVVPSSFAIEINGSVPRRKKPLPERHMIAVEKAIAADRAIIETLTDEKPESITITRSIEVTAPPTSVLSSAAVSIEEKVKLGRVRGKTSVAVLRAAVYKCLEKLAPESAISVHMFTRWARLACQDLHIDTSHYSVLRSFAKQISEAVQHIHQNIAEEADFHGSTLDDWWKDALDVMPMNARPSENNTSGWCVVLAWMLLNHPTPAWGRLEVAATKSTMARVLRAELRDIRTRTSNSLRERTKTAGQGVLQHMAQKFTGFYGAMWKVYQVVADARSFVGDTAHRRKIAKESWRNLLPSLKLGALLWQFRGRFLRSLHLDELDSAAKSDKHRTMRTHRGEYVIKAVPYRRYAALRRAIELDPNLRGAVLRHFPAPESESLNVISAWLKTLPRPLAPIPRGVNTRLLRYVKDPTQLADNIENDLMLIADDVRFGIMSYEELNEDLMWSSVAQSPDNVDWGETSDDEYVGDEASAIAAVAVAQREYKGNTNEDEIWVPIWGDDPGDEKEEKDEKKEAEVQPQLAASMGALMRAMAPVRMETDDGVPTFTYWDLARETEDPGEFVDSVEAGMTDAQLDEIAGLRFVGMPSLMEFLRMRLPDHPLVAESKGNVLR